MTFSMLRSAIAIGFSACLYTASANAQLDPLTVQIQPLVKSSLVLDFAIAGETLVAVGERGHVLILEHEQWTQVSTPVIAQLTKVFFIDEKLGWAVGHDATIIHSNDGGKTWSVQMQSAKIEKPFLDIRFINANEGIAVGAYGLFYRTVDGGKNWVEEFHSELLFEEDAAYLAELKGEDQAMYETEKASLLPHFNRVALLNDNRLLLVGELGLVAVSDDNGKTFAKVDFDYDGSMFDVISVGDAVYVMGLRGHVFKSDLGLNEWHQIDLPVESSINNAIAVSENKLYLVGNAGMILSLENDKVEIVERRQGENIVAISKNSQGQLWFAGTKGLFQLK